MRATLLLPLLLAATALVHAQPLRFFAFTTNCGHGNWQDTAFIAATADQAVIDTVLANLARPLSERKFINGPIDHGDGGHNHNADHWFLWHFIPGQWDLVELAIEVCDGCPYTDVDADTAYWIGTIGQFCPWSGVPVREVAGPTGIGERDEAPVLVLLPNPAEGLVHLRRTQGGAAQVLVYDARGARVHTAQISGRDAVLDLAHLGSGLYVVELGSGGPAVRRRLVLGPR
jgi:hypothetical protein